MKKYKYLLLIFLLVPIVFLSLTGCEDKVESHEIEVLANDIRYCDANPVGSGVYKTNQDVTIVVYPKRDVVFIGWTKNNIIVSTETRFTFKASKDTAGTYKAIFKDEQSIYSKLSKFDITCSQTISHISFKLFLGEDINFLNNVCTYESDYTTVIESPVESNLLLNLSKNNNYRLEVKIVQNGQTREFQNTGEFKFLKSEKLEEVINVTQQISASNPNPLYSINFTFTKY